MQPMSRGLARKEKMQQAWDKGQDFSNSRNDSEKGWQIRAQDAKVTWDSPSGKAEPFWIDEGIDTDHHMGHGGSEEGR